MERLDAVGVIYRLASSIAAEQGPIGLRWYRAAPLDASIQLPDGRNVGVVRQGADARDAQQLAKLVEKALAVIFDMKLQLVRHQVDRGLAPRPNIVAKQPPTGYAPP